MTIQLVAVFFGVLCCSHLLSAVNGDDSLMAWSCSTETKAVSARYRQKVQDVMNAMEIHILTHASWDLVCQSTDDGDEDVVGSAGCIASKDMRNMEECYTCIVAARHHLEHRCLHNVRGSVFLNSCTLMYARQEG